MKAYVDLSFAQAQPDQKVKFERFGDFIVDLQDDSATHLVFNRAVGLKDSWGK